MARKQLGDFELVERLGGGAMGEVYLARQLSLGRRVALKVPRPELAEDEGFRRRFLREARNGARLNNPHIVQVYTAGEDEGTPYLAMEYVRGETLKRRLAAGSTPAEEAVRIALELCEALTEAHEYEDPDTGEKGIVHRDVKPENIFLEDKTGRVKLGDFGLSRAASDAAITSRGFLGTPAYASPEQCVGGVVDHRTDLYSLGLVLYEMLTGRCLSAPSTPEAVPVPYAMRQSLSGESPPEPHELSPGVPPTLSRVVMRALAVRANDRFSSAQELAEALRLALAEDETGAPSSAAEPPSRPPVAPTRQIRSDRSRHRPAAPRAPGLRPPAPPLVSPEQSAPPTPVALSLGQIVSHLGNRGAPWAAGVTPQSLGWGSDTQPHPDRFAVNPRDGAELVWVPPGSFPMGSEQGGPDERPVRRVTLGGFWLYKHEVTNGQFSRFVRSTGHQAEGQWQEEPGRERLPVVMVSWHDAHAYAEWAGVRLPTEAQWEHAGRGPEGRTYPWGNDWDPTLCCNREHRGEGAPPTLPVDRFPAAASWCGALDLVGNVWEWCADWYSADAYKHSASRDPQGPAHGAFRVLRGGCWLNGTPGYFRCPRRYNVGPSSHCTLHGFRCAR